MKKLWVTYAWTDNKDLDVDYILQELGKQDLEVRYDRAQLIPGDQLWPQIEKNIVDPNQSDAWAFIVSKQSLESAPCREELQYALGRALRTRGEGYKLIGIFLERVDTDLVPAAIRTRLYVTVQEQDWAKRVADGVYGRAPGHTIEHVPPYELTWHMAGDQIVCEIRPRLGRWYPAVAAVPVSERGLLLNVCVTSRGAVPSTRLSVGLRQCTDESWALMGVEQEANPFTSLYVFLTERPTQLMAGSVEALEQVYP